MVTEREALKLALEALEFVNQTGDTQTFDMCYASKANNLHAQCYGTIGSLVNALRAKDDGAWIAEQKDLFGDDHGQR